MSKPPDYNQLLNIISEANSLSVSDAKKQVLQAIRCKEFITVNEKPVEIFPYYYDVGQAARDLLCRYSIIRIGDITIDRDMINIFPFHNDYLMLWMDSDIGVLLICRNSDIVIFDDIFNLENAAPIPSLYNYILGEIRMEAANS